VWKNKIKKQVSFYVKKNEITNVYFSDMSMILLVYIEIYFNTNELDPCIPNVCIIFYSKIMRIFSLIKFLMGFHILNELNT